MIILTHAIALLLGAVAGALVYRKNQPRIEKVRAQGGLFVDAFKDKK